MGFWDADASAGPYAKYCIRDPTVSGVYLKRTCLRDTRAYTAHQGFLTIMCYTNHTHYTLTHSLTVEDEPARRHCAVDTGGLLD